MADANIYFSSQVLAVDLLNPSPAAEAKKHKLKVRLLAAPSHTMLLPLQIIAPVFTSARANAIIN